MMRLLFWIALIVLVAFAVRSKLRAMVQRNERDAAPRAQARPRPPEQIETMTQCAHCGLYFPVSEAVHADGHDYCSAAHAQAPRD